MENLLFVFDRTRTGDDRKAFADPHVADLYNGPSAIRPA
jgi:hypothetical protein